MTDLSPPNPPILTVDPDPRAYVSIQYTAACPLNFVQANQGGNGIVVVNSNPSLTAIVYVSIVTNPGGAITPWPQNPLTVPPNQSIPLRCTLNVGDNNTYTAEITSASWLIA
jgi:hypothetical protein